MTNYEKISTELYNLTKPPGTSIDGDLEFYKKLLMPLEGKVLEAGVGNGRLLIPFLKYGIDIEGIDNSIEMINKCQLNLKNYGLSTNIINMDLLEYFNKDFYKAIIMPNGSFCLLDNYINVLENFYFNLKKDGFIAIDLIYPISFKLGDLSIYEFIDENNKITIENYSKEINWEKQFTINEIKYKSNNIHEIQNFKLNWYGINELKLILEKVGFKDIKVIKNYNLKRLLNLKTITIIANK